MDDEDSQEELINRNASHNAGRRAELWAISDDSDDVDEESEEGESDSSEEQEEGHQEGGDEEEEEEEGNEEEDDEEEGENDKAEDGAFGETSADLAGLSSDDETEKCPICLNSFSSQPVATPENCSHYFCLDCILEWTKNANSCPVDRIAFNSIYLRKCYGGKVKKMITVQKPVKEGQEERVDLELEQTNCEVCGGSDREDRLLLCDGCDAGYHMECLTPPLDSVPVEEWFCPECEANNRHSRASDEGLSDAESLPSTALPATSHSQAHAAGPTRAIARTQQSERVRANVNRHRITQARTSQLAPTYLIQSTWLDETINAVVAGLNTAVYVRDFTPRAPPSCRRRTRKVKRKTSSQTGKKGKASSAGVRRRRKVRRTKSRKKPVLKRATPRNRIANNLGIVKGRKGSSLPAVYRPSEHTLSGMRADIGAASLSIYGDPFDLDPFVDHEQEEQQQQAHVSSLLEAKRRGISRSALRSHQPVARPVTASLSRRSLDVPQSEGVVEASPGPDLLGSILSGQSMLLMDSSDIIINRDGSLKATKPVMASELKPGLSRNSSSEDSGAQMNPEASPNQGNGSMSPCYSRDPPGSFHRTFSQRPPRLPSHTPPSASRTQSFPNSGHPSLQPTRPISGTSGVGAPCPKPSIQPTLDHSSKGKEVSTSTKAPVKPTWVDVSVLPRIPKIRKDRNGNSTASSNGCVMPETGMNSLAGDKERKQSVDQQKGRSDGRAPRPGPDAGSSSSAFSNSFSSSPASHPRYSSSSSASSAVSFRINSSGNSWHSKRASFTPTSAGGGSAQKPWKEKEDEAKKRRLHRDKRMLLASRTLASDGNNIYDPFNPTMSDSSDSDEESEGRSPGSSSQHSTHDEKNPGLENKKGLVQNKQGLVPVKVETQEVDISEDPVRVKAETREVGISENPVRVKAETQEVGISEEQPKTASGQEMISEEDYVKVKEESRVAESETVNQTLLDARIKKQPDLEDLEQTKGIGDFKSLISEKSDTKSPVLYCLDLLKAERETLEEGNVGTLNSACLDSNSTASSSAPTKNKQKSDSKSDSKSQSKDVDHKKKASRASKEHRSSSPDTDRGRRGDRRDSGQEVRQKEKKKDQERSTRRSRERRRRSRSTSERSRSSSPDKTVRKRRRSRSKERRRSRSVSGSSSRERSQNKRHKRRSDERRDGRERDSERRRGPNSKRHGRSRSKSRSRSRSRSKEHKRDWSVSKSRSRSRSRERRTGQTRTQQSFLPSGHKGESSSKDERRRRSRSSSRERRREGSSSKALQKTSGSSKDTKPAQTKKIEEDTIRRSLKQEEEAVVVKQETSSSAVAAKVKTKGEDVGTVGQATAAEEETVVRKEIKKEKRPLLDMFEDSPVTKPIKEEESLFEDSLITKTIKKGEPMFEGSPVTKPINKGEPMFEGSTVTKPIKKGEPMFEDPLITKPIKKVEPMFEGSTVTKPIKKVEPMFEGSPVTKPVTKEPMFEDPLITKPIKKGEPMFEGSTVTKPIKKVEPMFEGSPVTKPVKKEPMFEDPLITKPIKKEPMFEGSPVTKPVKKEPLFEGSLITKPIKKGEPLFEDSLITKPIKKEEPIFEGSLITKPIKKEPVFEGSPEPIEEDEPIFEDSPEPIKEEPVAHVLMLEKEIDATGKEEAPIKMETCEIPMINSEPSFSEFPNSSLTAVVTPDRLQDAASGSHPELPPPAEQPNVAELTAPVKQEVRRPSDSDDDFNFDVMLDRVKPEHVESPSVKREDAAEEGRKEGGQVLTAPGAKPKSQVKRVTWNIQEPEGPQPEKSASKLALYKLKLKQEGARRPSATGQSSSQQDIPGAVSNSKRNAALLSHPSRSDGAHPDEGDSSRKDMYLKKLHMQERAIEEVKLAIKPFYQRRDITKDEYKDIVRKAVQKVCHSKSGEINPVKVGNLVKAYVDKYKHARKHKGGDDAQGEFLRASESP